MPASRPSSVDVDFEVISPGGKASASQNGPNGPSSSTVQSDPVFAVLSHVLDSLFKVPGTNWRFGLDPLIGLIPGVGDSSAAIISAFLIIRGAQAGLPRVVLLRMAANVLINAGVGAIPGVGDAFSVWFKSNRMNYELFEKHAGRPGTSKKADWLFVGALLGGLFLLVGFAILLSFTLMAALWHLAWGSGMNGVR